MKKSSKVKKFFLVLLILILFAGAGLTIYFVNNPTKWRNLVNDINWAIQYDPVKNNAVDDIEDGKIEDNYTLKDKTANGMVSFLQNMVNGSSSFVNFYKYTNSEQLYSSNFNVYIPRYGYMIYEEITLLIQTHGNLL